MGREGELDLVYSESGILNLTLDSQSTIAGRRGIWSVTDFPTILIAEFRIIKFFSADPASSSKNSRKYLLTLLDGFC